jgi:hypothetical protein
MVGFICLVVVGYYKSQQRYRMETDMDTGLSDIPGGGCNSVLFLRQTEEYAATPGF